MTSMREQIVRNYIQSVNWKTDDWNYKNIEEELKQLLGEKPAIDIKYKKDIMINEFTGEAKEINALNSVSIIFTDDDDKRKKLDILI